MIPPVKIGLVEEGNKRKGVIISLPVTAKEMLDDRERAKKYVVSAIKKAKKS